MAKKAAQETQATEGVNKSQVIREALAEMPESSPKEIAERVNSQHNLGVTAQYVSVVKSQDKKKSGPGTGRGNGRKQTAAARTTQARAVPATPDVLDASISLVEAAGGLDGARAALDRLERLRGRL